MPSFFLVGKHCEPQSINAKLFLTVIGIVAYAFTLLWDNPCRNSCKWRSYDFLYHTIKMLQWRLIHLIRKDASQIIHRCYSNSSLVLSRQTLHDVFRGHRVLLGGRRLSHEGRRIWRETEGIHLREINRCMLTGARKNDDVQQVGKLFNARNWWREAVICLSLTDWIAIVVKI